MRIAHLDTGRTWRGGQAQVLALMRGLRARGHESLLLAPDAPLAARARGEGFRVERWRPWSELDLVALLAAAGALRGFRADVAHAHTAHAHALGVPAARLAGTRAVVVSRRVDAPVGRGPLSRLKYALPVDRWLCVSGPALETLAAAGVPRGRLARVPSGVDPTPPPAPATGLATLVDAEPGAPLIGTLAALTAEKDHATLLEAVPEVLRHAPQARFAWLGEGPCRAALERRIAALGLARSVRLLGFRADARALLAGCTLCVSPSRAEALGTALLEAQALGVPVVATDVGGVRELVTDRVNGALVPAGDPAALARAIVEALADPAGRAAWSAAARVSVAAFSLEAMVERTLAEYGRCLAG